jgi:hypothetical protein
MMTEQRALSGSPVMNASKTNLTSTLNGDYLDITKNPAWDPMQKAITDSYSRGVAAQTDGAAARSNNLGSSGYREQVATNQRALGESLSSAAGGLYNSERGRQMQANLFAPQAAAADYADASALMDVGGAYQGQQQKEMDWPYKQLDVMGGALGAGGRYGTTTSTSETPDPRTSTGAKVVGGLLTAGGLYNAYTGMGSPLGTPSDWYDSLFGSGGGDYGGFNSNWAYGDAIDSGSFTAGSDAAATGAGTAAGGLNYGGIIGGLGSLYNISQGNGGLMDYAKTAKTGYDLYNSYNAAQAATAAQAAGSTGAAGSAGAGAAGSTTSGATAAGSSGGTGAAAGAGFVGLGAAALALNHAKSQKQKAATYEGANRTLQRFNDFGLDVSQLTAKDLINVKSNFDNPDNTAKFNSYLEAARNSGRPVSLYDKNSELSAENPLFASTNPYSVSLNPEFERLHPGAIQAAGGEHDILGNYALRAMPGYGDAINQVGSLNDAKIAEFNKQIEAINAQRFGQDWRNNEGGLYSIRQALDSLRSRGDG